MNPTYHVLVIAPSGAGKSLLGAVPPAAHEPSEDSRAETAATRRDRALKTTYWATSDSNEFCNLRDALCHFGKVFEVSEAQQRAFFMALPATTFGQGVTWGFDDTEVRDDVWRFAQDNPDVVAAALAQVEEPACSHTWGDWQRTSLGRERTCSACGLIEGEDWMEDVRYERRPAKEEN